MGLQSALQVVRRWSGEGGAGEGNSALSAGRSTRGGERGNGLDATGTLRTAGSSGERSGPALHKDSCAAGPEQHARPAGVSRLVPPLSLLQMSPQSKERVGEREGRNRSCGRSPRQALGIALMESWGLWGLLSRARAPGNS